MVCATHAPAATLGYVQSVLPSISNDTTGSAATFANASGGHTGLLTFELEDDYDAIQIGVLNQYTSAWGIDRVVVAPSASYGGDPMIGRAAYDLDGNPIADMLPIQWSNAGANSAPSGNAVIALPVATATPAGTRTLPVANTTASAAYGSAVPGAGWYVADGLGCIPPRTTIASVSPTSLTLSRSVAGAGCGKGQDIYLSPAPFGPFAQAIPAATTFGALTITLSDWVPMASLPRLDGGFAAGATVTGPGVPDGTTLAAVGYTSLTLSQPLANAMPAQARLAITTTTTLGQDAQESASALVLTDNGGIRPGRLVTGSPSLAPGTRVVAVNGNSAILSAATLGPIAAGTTLGFQAVAWTTLPAAAGATTLAVPSTTGRPLLHVRYFTQAGSSLIALHKPGCSRNPFSDTLPCEAPLGLPTVWASYGGQKSSKVAVDGVNFVSQIGPGSGSAKAQAPYPSFFIRFLGRHAGATLLVCGGFQSAGASGSVSGEAGPGRVGAAWASLANPAVPISVASVASRQIDTGPDFDNCTHMIDTIRPSMALMQDYSNHNFTQVADYRASLQAVAEHALSVGVQPIIYLGYPEGSAHVGSMPVAADVSGATTVPLLTGLSRANTSTTVRVTGPGIADGTLAQPKAGSWQLVLSQPATLAAGSMVQFSNVAASSVGTDLTLVYPAFLTTQAAISAPSQVSGTGISLKQGSVRGTLSSKVAVPANAVLGLVNTPKGSVANYTQAAQWFLGCTDPWCAVQLDGFDTLGTDAANGNLLCEGCSIDGAYANDYGVSLIAAQLVPILQRQSGQSP